MSRIRKTSYCVLGLVMTTLMIGCASSQKSDAELAKSDGIDVPMAPKTPVISDATSVTCSKGNDVRTVSNLKRASGGCEVEYVKFGEKNIVASAASDLGHCMKIMERIEGKLKASGYSCQ